MDIGLLLSENLVPSTFGDIMIYLVLVMALLTMFTMPEKNAVPSNMILIVVFACVIDLLRGTNGQLFATFGGPLYGGGHGYLGFGDRGFGTLMLHIVMALVPFLVAATIRYRGRTKNKLARITALIAGIIGSIYTIAAFLLLDEVIRIPLG